MLSSVLFFVDFFCSQLSLQRVARSVFKEINNTRVWPTGEEMHSELVLERAGLVRQKCMDRTLALIAVLSSSSFIHENQLHLVFSFGNFVFSTNVYVSKSIIPKSRGWLGAWNDCFYSLFLILLY